MQDGFVDWSKVDPESIELPAEEIARAGLDQPVEVELDDVKEESGFASVIVVDNLPQIPEAKFAKLLNVLTKIFSQIGEVREGGLLMPQDEATKTSLGAPPGRQGAISRPMLTVGVAPGEGAPTRGEGLEREESLAADLGFNVFFALAMKISPSVKNDS